MTNNKMIDNPENRNNLLTISQSVSVSSPLPPPDWVERYNDVDHNIITEMLLEVRENGKHNRKLVYVSQWHGFIATVLVMFFAVVCAYFNQKETAFALLGISLMGVIKGLIRK
ncbi:MAG: hypothetical protein Ta2D_03130 [Rickettsiales bacterium]|nr:MAG: hypothetical protein Ta2D_03130 [Rickettsiales bacterium]